MPYRTWMGERLTATEAQMKIAMEDARRRIDLYCELMANPFIPRHWIEDESYWKKKRRRYYDFLVRPLFDPKPVMEVKPMECPVVDDKLLAEKQLAMQRKQCEKHRHLSIDEQLTLAIQRMEAIQADIDPPNTHRLTDLYWHWRHLLERMREANIAANAAFFEVERRLRCVIADQEEERYEEEEREARKAGKKRRQQEYDEQYRQRLSTYNTIPRPFRWLCRKPIKFQVH